MKIAEVNRFSNRIYDSIIKLLPQLASESEMPSEEHIREVIRSKNSHLFIAETDNKVIGTLTVAIYYTPSGKKFWIEDVIVDELWRGKGLGEELMVFAIEFAKTCGVKNIDLTTRPSRIAANKLYQKTGFVLRETNVYRYSFNS